MLPQKLLAQKGRKNLPKLRIKLTRKYLGKMLKIKGQKMKLMLFLLRRKNMATMRMILVEPVMMIDRLSLSLSDLLENLINEIRNKKEGF